MAGRYVILEFEGSADQFLRDEIVEQYGGKAIGLFLKPKKYCNCPDKKRQDVKNWGKGKRTGLYLCKTCKLPSIHHQQGIMGRLQYVFGFNQLGVEDDKA